MLLADLDACGYQIDGLTTTSWPTWARRRPALRRQALSSDTAGRSDNPEQRRRSCLVADSLREPFSPHAPLCVLCSATGVALPFPTPPPHTHNFPPTPDGG